MSIGDWTGGGGEDDGASIGVDTSMRLGEVSEFATAGVSGGNGRVELELAPALGIPLPESLTTTPGFGLGPDPVRAKGRVGGSCGPGDAGGKSRAFHVPGMSATGRIHVAVSMIPYPKISLSIKALEKTAKQLTFIVPHRRRPAPRNERPDIPHTWHECLE